MTGRNAVHRKLVEIVDNEPEWAFPAMQRYFERHRDGDRSDASYARWRDERAAAEAAHLAKTA